MRRALSCHARRKARIQVIARTKASVPKKRQLNPVHTVGSGEERDSSLIIICSVAFTVVYFTQPSTQDNTTEAKGLQ